jgi:DnaJ-class molecular chaperone
MIVRKNALGPLRCPCCRGTGKDPYQDFATNFDCFLCEGRGLVSTSQSAWFHLKLFGT